MNERLLIFRSVWLASYLWCKGLMLLTAHHSSHRFDYAAKYSLK